MVSLDSNHALSKPSDRPQDALDAATYLELVKAYLSADETVLRSFLLLVKLWLDYQRQSGSWDSHRRTQQCVIDMAKILKSRPNLLYGLNVLLLHGQRLECSTAVEEVSFFVLVDSNGARIVGTSHCSQLLEISDKCLRETVVSEERWASFLKAMSDKDWLSCVSELLRYILDDPATDCLCSRRADRCLRELAILPPSSLIRNVVHSTLPPVRVAGGGFTDIFKGYVGSTRVCLRVLKTKTDAEKTAKNFCSEVLLWSRLQHPNILPFWGANTELFPSKLCFVTPWISNGNLMEYLKSNPDHDRYVSVCEIVEGINYLHTRDPPIAHRDIKGSNVLVRDDGVCYLADFGLSSIEEDNKLIESSHGFKGTFNWAAPEVFYPPISGKRDLRAADMYSLGCTIHEIYLNEPPYWGNPSFVVFKLRVLELESELDQSFPLPNGNWTEQEKSLWWLVGCCRLSKPESRPTISLVQNFLQDIGTFKPQLLHRRDVLLPASAAAQLQESLEVLNEIKQWLDDELHSQVYFPHRQQKSTVRTIEGVQDATPEAPSEQSGCLQTTTNGISTVTFFEKQASFARFQGLHTPDTPSIPLELLDMPQPIGPAVTIIPHATALLKTPNMPTPPLTPRIHSPQCRIIGKSIVALRAEDQMFEPNINLSPRLQQPVTQLHMLRSEEAPSVPEPIQRCINPGGFRTSRPYSNYSKPYSNHSPSPLRHCTPSIIQSSGLVPRGRDFLEGVLPAPTIPESGEPTLPILRPLTRRK